MAKSLTFRFAHTFEGVIWDMAADEEAGYLVLEIRDQEAHEVTFAALLLPEGQLLWKGLRFEEQWWAKVQGLQNGVALFYISDGNMEPEVRELYALDVPAKEIIWHKSGLQVLRHAAGEVLCATGSLQSNRFLQVHLRTGQETPVESDRARLMLKQSDGPENKNIFLPLHYPKGNKHFDSFRQFLKEKFEVDAVKACDYLAHKNRIAISYYIYTEDTTESKTLANYLLIVDGNGSTLLHEKIQDMITAVGLETFFIINDQLIFVRNKKEIYSYGL